ncbi:MAG: C40 family peptidase [Burkholderiales bacterium]
MFSRKLTQLILGGFLLALPTYAYCKTVPKNATSTMKIESSDKDKIDELLLQSMSLIGIPYKWGGNTPKIGLDCSGFIKYIYKQTLGITLPRTSAEMANLGRNIPLNQLEPGDLLFFNTLGGRRISHMGMYLGNNKFIQAPRTGKKIGITNFNAYYHSKFIVAKRMVEEDVNLQGQTVLSDLRNGKDAFLTQKTHRAKKHQHLQPTYAFKKPNLE